MSDRGRARRWVSCDGGVIVPPPRVIPPLPRPTRSSIPASATRARAAGARGRPRVPRHRVRRAGRRRWRSRREHEPDGLPGGLHRPLLRRPARRDDVPADRQLRAAARRRPVRPAVAPRPDRGQRHGGRRRAGRPARGAAAGRRASPRSPAWTRARWRATCGRSAPSRGDRRRRARWTRTRPSSRARHVPRWEDQDFVGEVSPARPYDVGDPSEGGPLVGNRRPRAEEQHRAQPPPARRPGAGAAAHGVARGGAGAATSTALVLSPGPGDPARLDGQVALARGRDRRRAAAARDLSRSPDRRPRRAAPRRGGCASAITARTTRSGTSTPG